MKRDGISVAAPKPIALNGKATVDVWCGPRNLAQRARKMK
jgi:hypothetical protein